MSATFVVSIDDVNAFLKMQGYDWLNNQVIDKQSGKVRSKKDADFLHPENGINIVVDKNGSTKNIVLSYTTLGFNVKDSDKNIDYSDNYQNFLLYEYKHQYADYMIGLADWNIKKIVKNKMKSDPGIFGKNDKDAIELGGGSSAEMVADNKFKWFNTEEKEQILHWKNLKKKATEFMPKAGVQPESY